MYPRDYFDTFWRFNIRPQVFVAMSFDTAMQDIWRDIIKPAVESTGLQPYRVDVTTISGSIITDIMEGIAHARLVLGDLTAMPSGFPNANVMYEVGLAHALRMSSEVLLVRGDSNRLIFDVSTIRVHRYNPADIPTAKAQLARLMHDCLKEVELTKSLKVQQAVESLDGPCLRVLQEHAADGGFGIQATMNMGDIMSSIPYRFAVNRLFELGMICSVPPVGKAAELYHWTDFGIVILRRLGLRH
jgi:hypothetical protein